MEERSKKHVSGSYPLDERCGGVIQRRFCRRGARGLGAGRHGYLRENFFVSKTEKRRRTRLGQIGSCT
jgi:hypothetical protein